MVRLEKTMADIKNSLIMGNIYDPDTDCQYILMRCAASDWDEYLKELHEEELNGI